MGEWKASVLHHERKRQNGKEFINDLDTVMVERVCGGGALSIEGSRDLPPVPDGTATPSTPRTDFGSRRRPPAKTCDNTAASHVASILLSDQTKESEPIKRNGREGTNRERERERERERAKIFIDSSGDAALEINTFGR